MLAGKRNKRLNFGCNLNHRDNCLLGNSAVTILLLYSISIFDEIVMIALW